MVVVQKVVKCKSQYISLQCVFSKFQNLPYDGVCPSINNLEISEKKSIFICLVLSSEEDQIKLHPCLPFTLAALCLTQYLHHCLRSTGGKLHAYDVFSIYHKWLLLISLSLQSVLECLRVSFFRRENCSMQFMYKIYKSFWILRKMSSSLKSNPNIVRTIMGTERLSQFTHSTYCLGTNPQKAASFIIALTCSCSLQSASMIDKSEI